MCWSENIWINSTVTSENSGWRIGQALHTMRHDSLLMAIMVVSAATESAMYAFVIEWTPALTIGDVGPPHGIVFSAFMVAYMAGSTIYGIAARHLDATVILERPKLGPRKAEMRRTLAELLGVGIERVNLKGKTHEKVDAIGEGRAIEVHVVVLLARGD